MGLLVVLGHATVEPVARSESIGHPFSGRLAGAVRLPNAGPGFVLFDLTRHRGLRWATVELVAAVQHVARVTRRDDRAPLVVGNLSARHGGDIRYSRSHRTGRDVDLGLPMRDATGRSVASRYYRFLPDGRSIEARGRYRFDAVHTWDLLRAFLESPQVEVQWFILNPALARRVLDAGRVARAPVALLARAERLLTLPRYANLHRNHLHVRVLCSDGHERCDHGGPVWPWTRRAARPALALGRTGP